MNKAKMQLLLLMLVFILIFLFIVYDEIHNLDIEFSKKNLTNICSNTSYVLNKQFKDSRNFLELTSKYPIIMNLSLKHLEPFLKSLVQKFNIYNSVYVIDNKGKPVIDAANVPEVFDGVPSQVWFSNVVKGIYSDYITDVYVSDITRRLSITQAVLIRGPKYDLKAVLAAEIDMNYLWEQISDIYSNRENLDVYLLNENNEIIMGNTYSQSKNKKNILEVLGVKSLNLNDKKGILSFNTNKSSFIGAYNSIRILNDVKGMKWKILIVKKLRSNSFLNFESASEYLNIVIYLILFVIIFTMISFIFFNYGGEE